MPKIRNPFSDEQARLDVLLARLKGGDGMALFEALTLCWERGWQVPNWIQRELLVALRRFNEKRVVQLGEAFNVKPHSAKSVTKLRGRTKMVDAATGRSQEAVLRKKRLVEGFEFITNEERIARLSRTGTDEAAAEAGHVSVATARRIRNELGIKKIGGGQRKKKRTSR